MSIGSSRLTFHRLCNPQREELLGVSTHWVYLWHLPDPDLIMAKGVAESHHRACLGTCPSLASRSRVITLYPQGVK